jgi:hypothetical protein
MSAARLGDLHREVADAAGGAVDEDALAFLDIRRVNERLPGNQARQRKGRGVNVIDRCRLGREPTRWRGDVFRVRPAWSGKHGMPKTSSPGEKRSTPRPTAATVPDMS